MSRAISILSWSLFWVWSLQPAAGHVGAVSLREGADSVMFGHRTEHGGPYRYQHVLQGGDLAYVTTSDGRKYTFSMVSDVVSSKYSDDILAQTRRIGGETISIVACSRPDRLPTSLEYRLISTFELVGWEDLG